MLRVCAPIMEAQLLETPLLNLMNFPTLAATKAARIAHAADGDSVVDFGLRKAQGIDGGVSAARGLHRRLRRHLECAGRAIVRHSGLRHPGA
jgi:nicotinate phosphoribosyltransferase